MGEISKIERKGVLYNVKDNIARELLQRKYTKPIGGIPKEDLSLEVQNLLQAARTALQRYTETDPTVPAWAKSPAKPVYTAEEVGALPSTTHIPADPVNADWNASSGLAQILNKPVLFSGDYNDLINKPVIPSGYDDTALSGRITTLENAGFITQESDPTVPSWAKASTKPSYTASEVGALPADTHIPVDPVQSNWSETDNTSLAYIQNKPSLFSGSYNDLTDKPSLFSGSYTDLTNKPSLFSGSWNDLIDKPSLFSGSYTDLTDKPTLFSGNYTDLTNKPSLFSGNYNDLTNKPTIPTTTNQLTNNSGFVTSSDISTAIASLVDSAPATLDTLNELAAALGDDPNFATTISTALGNKVDKVTGKGLSTEDYTTSEKTKLAGLSNYDDTALQAAVAGKVDKESGKSLMTDAEHTKLSGIASGAEVNVQADWNQTTTTADDYIKNKPDVPTAISVNQQSFPLNNNHAFVIPDYYTKTQIDNAGYVKAQRTLINIDDSDGLVFTDANGDAMTHSQVKALLDDEATDVIFYKDCYFYILQYIEDGDYLFQCFECDGFVVHVLEFFWADNAFNYSTADYDYSVDFSLNSSSYKAIANSAVTAALNGKQNTLTFDNAPTANSNNPVKSGGVYTALAGKANTADLATVATSGSYDDLTDKPTIPSAYDDTALANRVSVLENAGYITSYTETDPTVPSWAKESTKPSYTASEISGLSAVATSGSYNDLSNKPTIPTVPTTVSSFTNDSGYLTAHQSIKTVNGQTMTGTGDIAIKVYMGTCPTSATVGGSSVTQASRSTKICTVETFPTDSNGKPLVGTVIGVKYAASNTFKTDTDNGIAQADHKINVNNTGDITLYYNNAKLSSSTSANTLVAGYKNRYAYYVYDGTYWVWLTASYDSNTTYSGMTQAEVDAGTSTTNRLISPKMLRNNFYTEGEVDTLLSAKADSSSLATVATSGSYNDLSSKPTIPTKVSDLQNDSGFTTNAGTVTGVKMNNGSAISPVNGVVDLGTVLTSHQDISGKADVVTVVTNSSTGSVSQALDPNKFYKFTGALTALTLTLNAGTGFCIYAGKFTSDSGTACTVTLPNGVVLADNAPSVEAGGTYEFSIAEGLMLLVKEGS